MGKRSTGRKLAMQLLFQSFMKGLDSKTIRDHFESDTHYHVETKRWAVELFEGASDESEKVNELIRKYAIDWDLDRLNMVDRSILHLAFYELLCTKTHYSVVLNEAIELSKKYSTEESPKFVNGVLGEYVKHVYGNNC